MSSFSNPKGSDAAVVAAKKLAEDGYTDWTVVTASDDVLQIDYDRAELPEDFLKTMNILQQRYPYGYLRYSAQPSKSGEHLHVIIHLPEPMNVMERVAWQAAFGSDGKREALNLLNISKNVTNPVLLFMHKDNVEKLEIYEPPKDRKIRL